MAKLTRKQLITKAAECHSDLNLFACIVTMLEGGHLYNSGRSQTVANRIIALCQREQSILLSEYDDSVASACKDPLP